MFTQNILRTKDVGKPFFSISRFFLEDSETLAISYFDTKNNISTFILKTQETMVIKKRMLFYFKVTRYIYILAEQPQYLRGHPNMLPKFHYKSNWEHISITSNFINNKLVVFCLVTYTSERYRPLRRMTVSYLTDVPDNSEFVRFQFDYKKKLVTWFDRQQTPTQKYSVHKFIQ